MKQETDLRRFPPIPRATKKFEQLYEGRTSVERVNSRLKVFWGTDDGNTTGAARFHAYFGAVMVVHATFATLLAAAPRFGGVLGQTRLLKISQSLQKSSRNRPAVLPSSEFDWLAVTICADRARRSAAFGQSPPSAANLALPHPALTASTSPASSDHCGPRRAGRYNATASMACNSRTVNSGCENRLNHVFGVNLRVGRGGQTTVIPVSPTHFTRWSTPERCWPP